MRTRWLEQVTQDTRLGSRLLRRQPGLGVTAALTLAVGVGLNVAVFSAMRAVLLDDYPYPEPDRIVEISQVLHGALPHGFSTIDLDAIGAGTATLSAITGVSRRVAAIRGARDAEQVPIVAVTGEFFAVFGVAPLLGRVLTAGDTPDMKVAVLSYRVWASHFARDPDVVGRTVRLDREPWTIVGVMPPHFAAPGLDEEATAVWVPHARSAGPPTHAAFARLAPGASIAQARAQLDAVVRLRQEAEPVVNIVAGPTLKYDGATLEPLGARDAAASAPALFLLQGIAAFLLLIACANIANLLLAHSASRHREFGMRAALGAGRGRLIRQLLTEAGMIATAGGVLGVGIALAAVPVLMSIAGPVLPSGTAGAVRGPELAIGVGLAWMTTLLFGVIPAVLASRVDPLRAMRGVGQRAPGRAAGQIRAALVAVQVLLALVVLTGAGLLVNSFARVISLPLGFDARDLVIAELMIPAADSTSREEARRFNQRAEQALADRFGGVPVSIGSAMPFGGTTSTAIWAFGSGGFDENAGFYAESRTVSTNFFGTLGIPIARGRGFEPGDRFGAPAVALVNQAFVDRFARGRDLVGTSIQSARGPLTIVGIAGNTRTRALASPPAAAVYTSIDQRPSGRIAIAARTPDLGRATEVIRSAISSVDRDAVVVSVQAVQARIATTEARRRFFLIMLSLFAVLSGALSLAGIHGVTAHATAVRLRELAIRLALGAQPRRLEAHLVLSGLRPVVAGLAGGVIASWWLGRLLQAHPVLRSQLFEVTSHDPATFVAATSGLLIAAAAAGWIPARRVDAIAPVSALKSEG